MYSSRIKCYEKCVVVATTIFPHANAPNVEVVDRINLVKQLANQFIDLNELVLGQIMINKILSTLPSRFKHMHLMWNNIPCHEQTLESLTLRVLKEEI
jgi:hypothetical protein